MIDVETELLRKHSVTQRRAPLHRGAAIFKRPKKHNNKSNAIGKRNAPSLTLSRQFHTDIEKQIFFRATEKNGFSLKTTKKAYTSAPH